MNSYAVLFRNRLLGMFVLLVLTLSILICCSAVRAQAIEVIVLDDDNAAADLDSNDLNLEPFRGSVLAESENYDDYCFTVRREFIFDGVLQEQYTSYLTFTALERDELAIPDLPGYHFVIEEIAASLDDSDCHAWSKLYYLSDDAYAQACGNTTYCIHHLDIVTGLSVESDQILTNQDPGTIIQTEPLQIADYVPVSELNPIPIGRATFEQQDFLHYPLLIEDAVYYFPVLGAA